MRNVNKLNTYECEICGRKANTKQYLTKHKYSHLPKSKSCPVCKKLFRRNRDAIKHTVVHTGAKDYECDTCGNKFGLKENLTQHQSRIHKKKIVLLL